MSAIDSIKIRLEHGGFTGLYAPSGECGCALDDLAPCGNCTKDNAGWINGCVPGHLHHDPRSGHGHEWAISRSKTPMSAQDFADMDI